MAEDAAVLPAVFLMINSLETGGSERQFVALAESLDQARFRRLTGCIMRRGPLMQHFNDIPEFRLGGSLYGMQSLRARWRLARYLKQNRVAVAHAFDFYTNLTLIPAARLAGVRAVI